MITLEAPIRFLSRAVFVLALLTAMALPGEASADVGVFARIPASPGLPEGIATGTDGTVYVGTNPGGNTPGPQNGTPSKIYAYSPDGAFIRDYTITGQQLDQSALPAYGLQQLAVDANGLIYALDKRPARVLTIDPQTGEQLTYATFGDLKTCTQTQDVKPCSATLDDAPPFPNYPAFAPDGSLIVSDFQQALLWRVPPGGGEAQLLLTDPQLDNPAGGPNGLQFRPDGRTLVFTQSISLTSGTTRLYEVQISDGKAGPLRQFYEGAPGDGGDGLALGASGDVFLNSFTSDQIIRVAPDGHEVSRVRTEPDDPIQFDAPASSVFVGDHLLVTNQSVVARNAGNFAVLSMPVGESATPLFRPTVAAPPRSTARLRVKTARRKHRRQLRVRVTLVPPAGVAPRDACTGKVSIRVRGRSRTRRLSPSCTFRTTFRVRRHRHVRVRVRFTGNDRLTPVAITKKKR